MLSATVNHRIYCLNGRRLQMQKNMSAVATLVVAFVFISTSVIVFFWITQDPAIKFLQMLVSVLIGAMTACILAAIVQIYLISAQASDALSQSPVFDYPPTIEPTALSMRETINQVESYLFRCKINWSATPKISIDTLYWPSFFVVCSHCAWWCF